MKNKHVFLLLPILLISSCSIKTTKHTSNTFSRDYSLRFIEDEEGNELNIKDLFAISSDNPTTYIQYRFEGSYELSINYLNRDTDSFVTKGIYNINNLNVNMVEDNEKYTAIINYPNYEKVGKQYILYLGLEIKIYVDNETKEKTPVMMWFWSNIFVPVEKIPELTIN